MSNQKMLQIDDELWTLVESVVIGAADADGFHRLEKRLHSDAAARQFYVEYLDLHAQLQWRTRGQSDGASPVPAVEMSPEFRRRKRQLWLASLAAICSLATAAAVFF